MAVVIVCIDDDWTDGVTHSSRSRCQPLNSLFEVPCITDIDWECRVHVRDSLYHQVIKVIHTSCIHFRFVADLVAYASGNLRSSSFHTLTGQIEADCLDNIFSRDQLFVFCVPIKTPNRRTRKKGARVRIIVGSKTMEINLGDISNVIQRQSQTVY